MEQSPSSKLTVLQLVKEFSSFYRIRAFIIEFTSARHLSLSAASWIQSIPHNTPPEDSPYYYYHV